MVHSRNHIFSFSRVATVCGMALLLSVPASAQQPADNNESARPVNQLNMTFTGDETRIGIGIDDNGDIVAEILKSFASSWRRNWLGEAWYAGGAAGLKLNYHWLRGVDAESDLADRVDAVSVWKAFLAVDQNTFDDSKLTLGTGAERDNRFWSVTVSRGMSGKRLTEQLTSIQTSILSGVVGNHATEQEQTIETTTFWYEQAYELGAGARIGRFFESALTRVSAGIDYEKGDYSSKQWTAGLNLEKYFRNTGHSLALSLEQLYKTGDYQPGSVNDTRAILMYRYDFGSTYRPSQRFEEVKVADQVALQRLREERRQVMQNQVNLSNRTFFDLDSAELKPDSKQLLSDVADKIKQLKLASKITIVGHTCDLGSERYNQGLSERRAISARDYLVSLGVPAEQIVTYGKGESEPLEPNIDEAHRRKNRRVEISFLSVETSVREVEIPADEVPVKWVKKPVQTPPAWIDRALRNPIKHKRRVDTYRFRKIETQTTLGEVVVLNEAPQAQDDSIQINHNPGSVVIPVLDNDSDPENANLSIVDVSQPANGTVINNGNSLTYTPASDFVGTDTFAYTIDDGYGGQSTATVTVVLINQAPLALDDGPYVFMANTPQVLDVLSNDSDPDGDVLTIVSVDTNGLKGVVIINGDGTLTYIPPAGAFILDEEFGYTITDPHGETASARVRVSLVD